MPRPASFALRATSASKERRCRFDAYDPDASDGVLYAVCISYRAVSSVCTGAAVSAPLGLDLSRPPGCAPVEAAPLPYRRNALCANLAVRVQPVPSKCSPGSKVPILGNMLIIFGVGAVCGFEPQRDAAFSMIAMCPFRHDAAVRSAITAWATCASHIRAASVWRS